MGTGISTLKKADCWIWFHDLNKIFIDYDHMKYCEFSFECLSYIFEEVMPTDWLRSWESCDTFGVPIMLKLFLDLISYFDSWETEEGSFFSSLLIYIYSPHLSCFIWMTFTVS